MFEWFFHQLGMMMMVLGISLGMLMYFVSRFAKSNPDQAMKWAWFTRQFFRK